MIAIHNLPATTSAGKKRIGRGMGTGKGKSSGRGTKGQRSRGKIPLTSGPGAISFFKRLPLVRGKYRNKPKKQKPIVVNLKYLSLLPPDSLVDLDALVSNGIVKNDEAKKYGVKILAGGEIKIPLKISLSCSKNAEKKIIDAGGEILKKNDNKIKPKGR